MSTTLWPQAWMQRKSVDLDQSYTVHGSGKGVYHEPGEVDPHSRRTNYIRTTKYTIWSFLPVNLFTQFRRFYNLYFLLSAILALVPLGVTPLSPATMVTPLVVVLAVTAAKDAYEDIKRYQADKAANNQKYLVIGANGAEQILSSALRPGMLIRVEKDQSFPADVLLLSTAHDDGLAYISTADLDGETNLKRRQALEATNTLRTNDDAHNFTAVIEGKVNTPNLYNYNGVLRVGDSTMSVGVDQLLLRGSMLRNTEYIYGIVLYVGKETKIMLNLKSSRLKFSSLENRLNLLVVLIFALNAIVLALSVVFSVQYHEAWGQKSFYLDWNESPAMVGVLHLVGYYILYTYMIPISLFVSIEISRVFQALFMYGDNNMRAEDGTRMRPQNSNLNEDLGRIDHIFTDKTGTLTQNIMALRYWYIMPGYEYEEVNDGAFGKVGRLDTDEGRAVRSVLSALAVCHTVIPAYNEKKNMIEYEGDSPDETALIKSLSQNDVVLRGRSPKDLIIEFFGREVRVELLKTLEFNSTRKRMSVIVRDHETGDIVLYCKGADNIIMERATIRCMPEKRAGIDEKVLQYAQQGLRTLLVARRTMTPEEFESFMIDIKEAEQSLEGREEKIMAVGDRTEVNLEIIGATAVEDRLQEDVAETIAYFLRCGIHVWMLTGDKRETATSIGLSTKLLNSSMHQMVIDATSSEQCEEELDRCIEEATARLPESTRAAAASGKHKGKKGDIALQDLAIGDVERNALIITGTSLVFALEHFPEKFYQLGELCISVICCRVTPLQKAQIVKLVKRLSGRICLSIGDGANDVSMIQMANVGVGVIGLEGTQAVRAADYAFKEFRALKRLIAVHGRYSYVRMAHIIYYSFYKNISMISVVFWYGLISAWSAQTCYQELIMTAYNILFTSLPPLMMAIFERDVDESAIYAMPELYREVSKGLYFNPRKTIAWGVQALFHGALLFVLINYWMGEDVLSPNGYSFGYWAFTELAQLMIISVVLFRWCFAVISWTWPMHAAFWISYAFFIGFTFLLYSIYDTYEWIPEFVFTTPAFYFGFPVVIVAVLLVDFVVNYVRRLFWPSDAVIAREAVRYQLPITPEGKVIKPVATMISRRAKEPAEGDAEQGAAAPAAAPEQPTPAPAAAPVAQSAPAPTPAEAAPTPAQEEKEAVPAPAQDDEKQSEDKAESTEVAQQVEEGADKADSE